MDLWFWTVVTVAVFALLAAWLMWGKAFSLQIDLDIAEDEVREAHAEIDRLKAEARTHLVRGERGQFRRVA